MIDYKAARNQMVDRQILARGVSDPKVLSAMREVPREEFIPPNQRGVAYADMPLPIGEGQTISQPYIVAYMIEMLGLRADDTVLEIGTGSAYAAAVLSRVAAEVFTVERVVSLAQKASETLASLGYDNVHVLQADGTLGWPEHAPFDAIVVSAGGPCVPESLKSQLRVGGRMVIPVGSDDHQRLFQITRDSETNFTTKVVADVRFVRLIGDEGWEADTG